MFITEFIDSAPQFSDTSRAVESRCQKPVNTNEKVGFLVAAAMLNVSVQQLITFH